MDPWDPVAGLLAYGGGFVPAFVLTCVIELGCYLAAFSSLGWLAPRQGNSGSRKISAGEISAGRISAGRAAVVVIGVNLVTHPLLWAVSLRFAYGTVLLAEVGVVLLEGLLVALVLRRPVRWSLLAALGSNAVSLLLGLLLLPGIATVTAAGAIGSSACC